MISTLLLQSLLFIGDSHSVGPFGEALNKSLRSLPLSVSSYAYCGSIANDWYKEKGITQCGYLEIDSDGKKSAGQSGSVPKFQNLLLKHRPQIVVVELSTNYFGYENETFIINDMRRMGRDIINSGAKCFWIGMPTTRKLAPHHARLSRLTKAAISDLCTYFDSFPVTSYPATGGDGIHFYFPGGREIANDWATSFFKSFQSTL